MSSIICATAIGAIGVFIAWQQWRIAEIRLRHDLYERRFKIYEAAKTLLVVFQFEGKITTEDYFNYLHGIVDAEFVISDPKATQYLQTLRVRAADLIGSQQRGAAGADQEAEIGVWLMKQFDVLKANFQPTMRLSPPSIRERVGQWFRE